jgi:hypothetical protein
MQGVMQGINDVCKMDVWVSPLGYFGRVGALPGGPHFETRCLLVETALLACTVDHKHA